MSRLPRPHRRPRRSIPRVPYGGAMALGCASGRLVALLLAGIVLGCAPQAGAGDEKLRSVSQEEALALVGADGGPIFLDVRTVDEFAGGHVPGAVNVPHTELRERIVEVEPYRERGVVLYCERGGRARKAARTLFDAGFTDVAHLEGDMSDWRRQKRPVER